MDKVEAKKRADLVRFLESQLGEVEYPAGSNRVKYNDWYYEKTSGYYVNSKPYAWCGTFDDIIAEKHSEWFLSHMFFCLKNSIRKTFRIFLSDVMHIYHVRYFINNIQKSVFLFFFQMHL